MPITTKNERGLTSLQQKAARLEAIGARATQIAQECGVAASTVSRWRRLDTYRAEVERLGIEHSDLLHRTAMGSLQKVSRMLEQELSRFEKELGEVEDIDQRARVYDRLLAAYKTWSAQVGITERTRVDQSTTLQFVEDVDGIDDVLASIEAELEQAEDDG